ncbi:hypothetical protein [Endozoicomonas arenosclerae]|uniref:hypothetical protein n=1 Tax=Endozoicomonas arenosclerae TaxID=1633495 RepID=UPI000785E40E|nr:hypothetical protein [Endozoicomonas arenosclerae]
MEVRNKIIKTLTVTTAVFTMATSISASADWSSFVNARVSHDRATDSYLGSRDTKTDFGITALDVRYGGVWQNDNLGSLDLLTRFYLAGSDKEIGNTGFDDNNSRTFAELKRFNYQLTNPVHNGEWQYAIGRTRFRESSGMMWDKDIEGFSLGFHSTLLNAEVRVSERLMAWRTDQTDFFNEDQKIRYYSGIVDYQWFYQSHISAFVLHQDDYSGLQPIGSLHNSEDIDRHDRNATWLGLSISSQFEQGIAVHLGVQTVKGEGVDSNSSSVGSKRQITGQQTYDISGWLLDAGVWWEMPQLSSWFGVNLTLTSKGEDKGDREGFIQSDLASNRYRASDLGLSFYKTGYAYRQTLENLSMVSLLYGFRQEQWRAGVQWNLIQRRNSKAGVGDSQISTEEGLIAGNHSLGQTLDFEVSWLPENLQFFESVDRVQLTMRAGLFRAGDAYGNASGKTRSRVLLEFKVRQDLEDF